MANKPKKVDSTLPRWLGVVALDRGIYLATFGTTFDMSMAFWRAQETFDGAYSTITNGATPVLVPFMEWYAKKHHSNTFTYTDDWYGFNLDRKALDKVYASPIPDRNKYDDLLHGVWLSLSVNHENENYSLIGVVDGDHETLLHEVAHCYYALDPTYAETQEKSLKELGAKAGKIANTLVDIGYSPHVVVDESQAYLATGLHKKMKSYITEKDCLPFKRTFAARFKGTKAEYLCKLWQKRVDKQPK